MQISAQRTTRLAVRAPARLFSLHALCLLLSAGCQVGPHALRVSHAEYNRAIQQTSARQLLLNLVRLKYGESPVFLEVGSVSAQFVFDQSGEITGTLNENIGAQRGNPDQLSLGGSVGFTERPTITYTPLSGDEFVQRLLSPIGVETILLLTHSGWRMDRVLRLVVQEMNGLDNARMASGPTPAEAPEYESFAAASRLLRSLQRERQLYLEYDLRTTEVSDPIPATLITADALVDAAAAGTRFRSTPEGNAYVLTKDIKKPILRLANGGKQSAEAAELRRLLQLAESREQYNLVLAQRTSVGPRDALGRLDEVSLDTRSLLGVMFYLSQAVDVPSAHRAAGLVTTTREPSGRVFDWSLIVGDLFRVHSARLPPSDAVVAVRHRGHWFYISDGDQNSKSTFILLGGLFRLQAGSVNGVAPVLTLPVGG